MGVDGNPEKQLQKNWRLRVFKAAYVFAYP